MIYFGWQMIFPTEYDGLSLTFREPFLSLYALGKFSAASFPLSELMRLAKESPLTASDAAGLLLHPMPWITAALSSAAFYQALPRIRLRGQALRRVLLLTGLGVPLPCLLISVSAKYLDWRISDPCGGGAPADRSNKTPQKAPARLPDRHGFLHHALGKHRQRALAAAFCGALAALPQFRSGA